jgi:hypothetical protein
MKDATSIEELLQLNPDDVKAITIPLSNDTLPALMAFIPTLREIIKEAETGILIIKQGSIHMCTDTESPTEHISLELFFEKIAPH